MALRRVFVAPDVCARRRHTLAGGGLLARAAIAGLIGKDAGTVGGGL